mmetsp:Transcript_19962/g.56304  ORF Transcript_19962/g.56304 Transcript_19962/m.56304 type:complete len:197 (+) Transcript_19962:80-670(+)
MALLQRCRLSRRGRCARTFVLLGVAAAAFGFSELLGIGFSLGGASFCGSASASRQMTACMPLRAAEGVSPTTSAAGGDAAREYFSKLGFKDLDAEVEEDFVARFRVISSALGGESEAYEVVNAKKQVLYYGVEHLEGCVSALREHLGQERAADVIRKNPAALTIPAAEVAKNHEQIASFADSVSFLAGLGKQLGLR